ncbi:MAG: hypothetical protein QW520_04535 [Methanomassiliicoccales archaeon]
MKVPIGHKAEIEAKIAEAVNSRAQTDEIIKGWWEHLPALGVIAGLSVLLSLLQLVPGAGGFILGYILMYTAFFCITAVLNFKLIRRLRAHFERENIICQELITTVSDKEKAKHIQALADDAKMTERLPSSLFSVMSVLPLVGFIFEFYYLYHLTRASAVHQSCWDSLLQEYSRMNQSHAAYCNSGKSDVHRHSYAFWAIASLIFFFPLALWYRFLIRDMNEHFHRQWAWEDQLLKG